MYLELTRPARRDYDPDGGDGTYLLIRDPGRQTVKYVTGQRPGRTDADALAEVDAVLARQGYGETIRDLARVTRRLPAAA
jgi:hypothetical protein